MHLNINLTLLENPSSAQNDFAEDTNLLAYQDLFTDKKNVGKKLLSGFFTAR